MNVNTNVNAQSLIDTANNTNLTKEERAVATSNLNNNSSLGYLSNDAAALSFAFDNHEASRKAGVEYGAVIKSLTLKSKDGNELVCIDTNDNKDGSIEIRIQKKIQLDVC